MTATRAQLEEMAQWRRVFFGTAEGRATLASLLRGLGLFLPWPDLQRRLAEDPAEVKCLLRALEVLAQCGVWTSDNFDRLVAKMAELPLPEVENE